MKTKSPYAFSFSAASFSGDLRSLRPVRGAANRSATRRRSFSRNPTSEHRARSENRSQRPRNRSWIGKT